MASQDVRPSPFAKMRANLSLRKSFLIYLAVAVLTACALSFATLLGLSRVLQGIYDQSYGGANNFIYLYDKANGTLVPCESINISLSEEEYVPVSRPIPSQRENAVPITDIRSIQGTFSLHGAYEILGNEPYAPPLTLQPDDGSSEETLKAMNYYYQEGWERFVAKLKEAPDTIAARSYAMALGSVPETAAEAEALFEETFGELAAPFDYFPTSMYTEQDLMAMSAAENVSYALIVVWFALCFLVAGNRFYKARLAKPVALLEGAADAIAQQNLDCSISYQRNDEMGKLAHSFETMRCSLEESQRQLWQTAEDRRQLNTAFAHDLRTPLVVLRGRVEMLEMLARQAEAGQVPAEAVAATCATLRAQIERLEGYVETMSRLQKLEDRTAERSPLTAAALMAALEDAAAAIAEESDKAITVAANPQSLLLSSADAREVTVMALDLPMVLEVAENLLANGARFAKSRVRLTVSLPNGGTLLKLQAEDDGPGFSANALAHGCDPFFSESAMGHSADKSATEADGISTASVACDDNDVIEAEALNDTSGETLLADSTASECSVAPLRVTSHQRAHESTKESQPIHFGTGLSVASELCSKHGGCLKLANRPEGGASVAAMFATGPTPNCTTVDSASSPTK